MTIELKVLAGLAAAVVALGSLFFGARAIYSAGDKAGSNRVLVAWDADRAKIQAVTDAAIAILTAEREKALADNDQIHQDYERQLMASSADNASLARRLQNAIAAAATGSGSLPQAGDQSRPPTPGEGPSLQRLASLTANLATECADNRAQLNALISEVQRQL